MKGVSSRGHLLEADFSGMHFGILQILPLLWQGFTLGYTREIGPKCTLL